MAKPLCCLHNLPGFIRLLRTPAQSPQPLGRGLRFSLLCLCPASSLLVQQAADEVAGPDLAELGLDLVAALHDLVAAGGEAAPAGEPVEGGDDAGDLLEAEALALLARELELGEGAQEAHGVGGHGVAVE